MKLRIVDRRSWVVILVLLALGGPLHLAGAIWPDQLGTFTRSSLEPVAITDKAIWEEYGLQASEQALYTSGSQKFTAIAYRLKDPTGAMAAFQWQRPPEATKSAIASLAVETPKSVVFAFHNYLFRLDGYKPSAEELFPLLNGLAQLDQGPLPILPDYLPKNGLVPNSERYVLGPASLDKFDPGIPPAMAAFHLGAEMQLGKFKAKGGEMALAIFSYPTLDMARERTAIFSRIPEALAKRSGPLVAVIIAPPNPDDAERLLAKIQYQASITWNERVPTARDNIGNLIVNIFNLTGLLLVFCASAGLAFGGVRFFSRRLMRRWVGDDPMILLHLEDR